MSISLSALGNPSVLAIVRNTLLTPARCEEVVASLPAEGWQEAGITGPMGTGAIDASVRSVESQRLDASLDWLGEEVLRAVADANATHFRYDLRGIDPIDGLMILRYEASHGDHYRPHRDYGPAHPTRKLTVVLQLSDPDRYIGGDLVFPDENLRAGRGQGELTMFPALVRHTVTPVVHGVRYAVVGWVHGPSYR